MQEVVVVRMTERVEEDTRTLVRRVELKWYAEQRESMLKPPMHFAPVSHIKENMRTRLTKEVYGFIEQKLSSMKYDVIKESEGRDYQFLDRYTLHRTADLFSKEINKLLLEIQNHIIVE